jgi:hypothetical protein
VLVVAHPSGELERWLRAGKARSAVIRPDGTVLAVNRTLAHRSSLSG